MKVKVVGSVIVCIIAYFLSKIDLFESFVWTYWSINTIFNNVDICYTKNPFIKSLFSYIEDRDLHKKVKIDPTVPVEINSKDYSFDKLQLLSNDWRQPVIVRGLFLDSNAVSNWNDSNYLVDNIFHANLTSVISDSKISAHYDRICSDDKTEGAFSEYKPFDEIINSIKKGSIDTVVFPPASRSQRVRNIPLEDTFNKFVDKDLDLNRIGGTFEGGGINTTVLTQMFLGGGNSFDDKSKIFGTGWHGDICNNFVVQITGVKKWLMVDTKYVKYLRPTMRNGKTAIVGAHISFETETMPYIPHHIFELYPGDMLYVPEFYYHSIHNSDVKPYAIGLISRQCNIRRNLRASIAFTSLILINHIVAGIFDKEARVRLLGAIFGKSLMSKDTYYASKQMSSNDGYTN